MRRTDINEVQINGTIIDWEDEPFQNQIVMVNGEEVCKELPIEDGTIQLQSLLDMLGKMAAMGGHANFGYSGFFRLYIYAGGKRRRLKNAWKLFPNNEHHYLAQYGKESAKERISCIVKSLTGCSVHKVIGGWEIDSNTAPKP